MTYPKMTPPTLGVSMTETGKIREINGKTVEIKPDSLTACFGCMKEECKACGSISAENPLSLSLKAGQTVEVSAPAASIFRQALAALVPPALGFIAGFLLTRLFLPSAGEGACAAAGVIFLFAAAFIVYAVRKRKPLSKVYTVTRIIE
jgi:sigma-E factor negative regulatory protein RseC